MSKKIRNLKELKRVWFLKNRKRTLRWFGPCAPLTKEQSELIVKGKWQAIIPISKA